MTPHADGGDELQRDLVTAPAVQSACSDGEFHLEDDDFFGARNRSLLRYTHESEIHDMICVGFGPASLAIAVALHDALEATDISLDVPGLNEQTPKVAFLEKQNRFAWHAGMLLPGARMQITFMKDMATLRNPRSQFTFMNYLYKHDRLIEFMNLNTFLPSRIEYEDYMRWCASQFEDVVHYGQEVVKITPEKSTSGTGEITTFNVLTRDVATGQLHSRRTRHVVIAPGGRPNIPPPFPPQHPKVVHSSQFQHISTKILKDPQHPYRIAVVGNGQSAAEIFDFLHSNYPNSRTSLLIKQSALRPSDDSPL
jgi:L-ornithine N5-monooxygenase